MSHAPADLTAAHALLQGLIDYAGLFPPAKLSMAESVKNYAAYLRAPESWMLGRFICPVSRLEEFRAASVGLLPTPSGNGSPGTPHSELPWPISAIIDGDLDENLDAIFAFNAEHSIPGKGLAVIDAAEIKVPAGSAGTGTASFIDESLDLIPEEVYPFFEFPLDGDLRGPVAALSGADAGAKLRTGGITPDAFPPAAKVAEFILACAAADVPFKATAGLHHPIRSEHPLTYEPGCARGVMHGFVNVFFAAALAHVHRQDRGGEETLVRVLSETNPRAFRFEPESIAWAHHTLDIAQVGIARETFALSFGSCSFTEPVQDLKALSLL